MAGPPDPATTEWVPIWTPMNTGPAGPTGPQGTPGEKWFAGTGAPSGSLASSIVGDWYLDTTTGDVYEKTGASAWTLRANIKGPQGVQGVQGIQGPIGATGPSGATAPHHVSHEPGGSDALVGAAWTAVANNFTQPQKLSDSAQPQLLLNESGQPVNARQWKLSSFGGILYIQPANDAGVAGSTALSVSRTGNVASGGDLSATTSGGNVACKNQANTFTQNQTLSGASPAIIIVDTAAAANKRRWNVLNTSERLFFQVVDDSGAFQGNPAFVDRSGNLTIGNALYESSRATPMGYWTGYTPTWKGIDGAAGTVGNGTLQGYYTVVGRTVLFFISFTFGSTSVGPATQWGFSLPPGFGVALGQINFGSAWFYVPTYDSGTAAYGGFFSGLWANYLTVIVGNKAHISPTVPFTWAASSQMNINGFYQY